jgi:hypothetical protein
MQQEVNIIDNGGEKKFTVHIQPDNSIQIYTGNTYSETRTEFLVLSLEGRRVKTIFIGKPSQASICIALAPNNASADPEYLYVTSYIFFLKALDNDPIIAFTSYDIRGMMYNFLESKTYVYFTDRHEADKLWGVPKSYLQKNNIIDYLHFSDDLKTIMTVAVGRAEMTRIFHAPSYIKNRYPITKDTKFIRPEAYTWYDDALLKDKKEREAFLRKRRLDIRKPRVSPKAPAAAATASAAHQHHKKQNSKKQHAVHHHKRQQSASAKAKSK